MRSFTLNKDYQVVCESEATRSGFRHVATLLHHGNECEKTKICYLNRTWESFEFESVLLRIIDAHFEGEERQGFVNIIKSWHY